MDPTAVSPNKFRVDADAVATAGLFAGLTALYLLLRQADLAYDGAMFSFQALHGSLDLNPTHPLLIPLLMGPLHAARALGVDVHFVGIVQSAAFTAAAAAVFFRAAREWGIDRAPALIYAILLGWNAAALENATSVELYGATFFAVAVSMFFLGRELRRPTRGGAAGLLAANCVLLGLHVGFAPWILSLYAVLMGHEGRSSPAAADRESRRQARARAGWRLAQGAATLVVFKALLAVMRYPPLDVAKTRHFFDVFWQVRHGWGIVGRLVAAPATDFAPNAGLLVYPAALGWILQRRGGDRAMAAMALHGALVSLLFLSVYSFWVVDRGSFYMPLLPAWGLASAWGLQAVARLRAEAYGGQARLNALRLMLLLGMAAFFLYGMIPFQDGVAEFSIRHSALFPVVSIALFYSFAGLFVWIGCGLPDAVISPPMRSGCCMDDGADRGFYRMFGLVAIVAGAIAYLPDRFVAMRPDGFALLRPALEKLAAEAADPDRLRVVTEYQPERVWVHTGVQAAYIGELWSGASDGRPYDLNLIANWTRSTADPELRMEVWLDRRTVEELVRFWDALPIGDLPRKVVAITPHAVAQVPLWRIGFGDPVAGRIHAMWRDPYRVEQWGESAMQWSKPVTEWSLAPERRRVRFEYWAWNPKESTDGPVRVSVTLNGETVHDRQHGAGEGGEVDLAVTPRADGTPSTLILSTEPSWTTPEGRTVGVALTPID